jgi:hypothetical protein
LDSYDAKPTETVRYKECGNVIEVLKSNSWGNGQIQIKKLSDDEYVNLSTGEILQCNHIENRSENKSSLRRTFSSIRDLINCNTTDLSRVRFVTFTYKENMTDSKRLYSDTKKLRMAVKYHFGNFEYISVAEPQGRGAWHTHEIWIFPSKAPYIDQKWLESDIWKHGSARVVKIDSVDNLGAYLTAYLGDISLEDAHLNNLPIDGEIVEKEYVDELGIRQEKRYVKGGRLQLYPPKFNIVRTSRNVIRPSVDYIKSIEAQKKIGSLQPTFKKTFSLSDDSGFSRTLSYEYYNKLR